MVDKKTYRDYFAIDEKYYAAVTEKLIEEGKVSWKNFYPHETFVKLLEKTHDVLSGKDSRSLWVEGAYGTGKSHAVLTVKSMLEASDKEVEEYFNDYGLSKDLCQKIIADKNNGKVIAIHRIGSASIRSDRDLILAVQESIMDALKTHNIENKGEAALRDSAIEWLEDKENREYFAKKIAKEEFAWTFKGKNAEEILTDLKQGTEEQMLFAMRGILNVAEETGVPPLRLDAQGMAEWIRNIIAENHLNAILFVWDEFTEFFRNNVNSLTGFQTLAEVSATSPFYFMIVSHESRSLFISADDAKKILDRFVPPVKIELPENMAFRLMAQAMKKTKDKALLEEWMEFKEDLNSNLGDVREAISDSAKKSKLGEKTHLQEEDLREIVPIHPYAAMILKHISVVFSSNQRSMFDFIISNDDDAQGFKWFINNYGPLDNANLLTADMLWNFFYVKGQNGLNDDVRMILDAYQESRMENFDENERRVFKTALLLQAVSQRIDNVEILKPNDRNLDLAYSGTDWPDGKASSIAEKLSNDGLLFKRVNGMRTEYIAAITHGDVNAIAEQKKAVKRELTTKNMAVKAELLATITLPAALKNRFQMESVAAEEFTKKINGFSNNPLEYQFRIVVSFAMDDTEAERVKALIEQHVTDERYGDLIFVNASMVPMGHDLMEQYVDAIAYSAYYMKSDKKQAQGYENQASHVLETWRNKIEKGPFVLYNKDNPSGMRCANLSALQDELKNIEQKAYPYGLAQFNVIDNMWNKGPLAQGAECGIRQELAGTFKSANKQTSLESALSDIWKAEDYWNDSAKAGNPIVKAKVFVEKMIAEAFEKDGRISMAKIIDALRKPKFGYVPCNFTAFILGFLLKEYAREAYFWSNGSTSGPMSVEHMKTMVANELNQVVSPAKKYKEEFIVAMSPQQGAFLQGTAKIFDISSELCGSVEQARDQIRISMKRMKFPMWCLKSILCKQKLSVSLETVEKVIDAYCGIVNTANAGGGSESDLANDIGAMFLAEPDLAEDLARIYQDELCIDGMRQYIANYKDGELIELSKAVGDSGAYMDSVKNKFNAEAANWVWNVETANDKIDDVILEYHIIQESNRVLPPTCSLQETVKEWNQKTNNIRIAYDAVQNAAGDLKSFLEILYHMKQQGILQEQEKRRFYELLLDWRESFEEFYNDQFSWFLRIAESFLTELSKDDAKSVFDRFSQGQFTKPKTEYYQYVKSEIDNYIENQAKMRLKALWQEKTGTKSPREWSEHFETPISCMFDDKERKQARIMLRVVDDKTPSTEDVDKALQYLQKAGFYDRLKDEAERDGCFMKRVVGDYAVMLGDAASVRKYLRAHVPDAPHFWMDNQTVTNQIHNLADQAYKTKGCEAALEVIDNMDPAELKRYLRTLIADNLRVGMEILRNK